MASFSLNLSARKVQCKGQTALICLRRKIRQLPATNRRWASASLPRQMQYHDDVLQICSGIARKRAEKTWIQKSGRCCSTAAGVRQRMQLALRASETFTRTATTSWTEFCLSRRALRPKCCEQLLRSIALCTVVTAGVRQAESTGFTCVKLAVTAALSRSLKSPFAVTGFDSSSTFVSSCRAFKYCSCRKSPT